MRIAYRRCTVRTVELGVVVGDVAQGHRHAAAQAAAVVRGAVAASAPKTKKCIG